MLAESIMGYKRCCHDQCSLNTVNMDAEYIQPSTSAIITTSGITLNSQTVEKSNLFKKENVLNLLKSTVNVKSNLIKGEHILCNPINNADTHQSVGIK